MEKKYCSKCGEKLESGKSFCPSCGESVDEGKVVDEVKHKQKNKGRFLDIVRYIIGAIFILGSLSNLVNGNWYGIIELLFAVSLMPFVYRKFIYKFIQSNKAFRTTQIVLPIILFIVFFAVIPTDNNVNNNYTPSNNGLSQTTKKDEKKELTESEKMILKITALMDEKLAFDTGNYIKGDIPAGEYAFVKFSGSGAYYSEEDNAGNIIDNENFDSFGYVKVHAAGNLTIRGVLISINAFEKLGVSGAKQIYEILNNQTDYHDGGYYKVGVDIPAGQYVLESYGSGYWAVMTGPVGSSEIVDNDNFNGRASVNVRDGQYLTISRSSYTKQ